MVLSRRRRRGRPGQEGLVAAADGNAGVAEVGRLDETCLHVGLGQHGFDDGPLLAMLGEIPLAQFFGFEGFRGAFGEALWDFGEERNRTADFRM